MIFLSMEYEKQHGGQIKVDVPKMPLDSNQKSLTKLLHGKVHCHSTKPILSFTMNKPPETCIMLDDEMSTSLFSFCVAYLTMLSLTRLCSVE
jgi:hypothetical protein